MLEEDLASRSRKRRIKMGDSMPIARQSLAISIASILMMSISIVTVPL
ncbi:unnamed protein product [Penicillium camemberti]|uniref:Str. FM013 n=1 Tax=Penicillium camemberti (strain FM 013) TaxID=1429867 RepID=A0A0G4PD08_PENC3|nr:unnamed protein product [Penicillium camemberti]